MYGLYINGKLGATSDRYVDICRAFTTMNNSGYDVKLDLVDLRTGETFDSNYDFE